MKILFDSLFEATDFMERINSGDQYEAFFKIVKGEVHVILQEKAFTVVKNEFGE